MTQPVDELVDAGSGHIPGGYVYVAPFSCGRTGCKRSPLDSHDFCAACLAWLRCDTDEDPLAKQAVPALTPGEQAALRPYVSPC